VRDALAGLSACLASVDPACKTNRTPNHTHVLARSESDVAISPWMQTSAGEFAQSYNRRKSRRGAFWSDRYHCTMIEEGPHQQENSPCLRAR
jgi:hypothetical protein